MYIYVLASRENFSVYKWAGQFINWPACQPAGVLFSQWTGFTARPCLAPDLLGVARDISLVPRHLSHSVNKSGLSHPRKVENNKPFFLNPNQH